MPTLEENLAFLKQQGAPQPTAVPAQQTPAPAQQTPAPAQQTPAPAQQVPAQETPAPTQQVDSAAGKETGRLLGEFNYGLTSMLGFPVDLATGIMRMTGLVDENFDPLGSSKSIRAGLNSLGTQFPAEGSRPTDLAGKIARIGGETILPAGGFQVAGSKLATKAFDDLNSFQKALVTAASKPTTTAALETAGVVTSAVGGQVMSELYPDNANAELFGELIGGITPSLATEIVKRVTDVSILTGNLKNMFAKNGATVRAEKTIMKKSQSTSEALNNLMDDTILQLDPVTRTKDVGINSLLKAAMNKDPEFAKLIADATDVSINRAKALLVGKGSSKATVDYLEALRSKAVFKAQDTINGLGAGASPVDYSRVIRQTVEESVAEARKTEKLLWGKLSNDGAVSGDRVGTTLEGILRGRTIASDPDDIPAYVTNLVGRVDKDGIFKKGIAMKKPTVAVLKDLRSRLGDDIAKERSLDAPNRNKIRVLSELNAEIYDSLAEVSPEYADAVTYSRELNTKFTQGRVGKSLGYERTGGASSTDEGTADFLLGASKENVRKSIAQLKQASPEAMPQVENYMKALFKEVTTEKGSGAFNVEHARRFLKQHETVLNEFPEFSAGITSSIDQQGLVDEMFGSVVGNNMSKYIKNKSVTSLYLDGSPDEAMKRILAARNDAEQGRIMSSLVSTVKQDSSGAALDGLKSAYGEFLIRHAEPTQAFNALSGVKFQRLARDTREAANKLFTKEELGLIDQIGLELAKIETRNATQAAKGVVTDAPSRIISLVGGTYASRLGAQAGAGTSGASLRTSGMFARQYDEILGKLTVDGANNIVVDAMKDPNKLKALLLEATPENIRKFNKLYGNFIPATALTSSRAVTAVNNGNNPSASELGLEDDLDFLRQNSQQQMQRAGQSTMQ